jgi:Raf kinase inhibitor-like YbhB/YbcL family protein
MHRRSLFAGLPVLFALGCARERAAAPPAPEDPAVSGPKITVTSSAFRDGQPIPRRHAYRGEGENLSPPLSFSGVPATAKELELLCDDPDAPSAKPWVHWVLCRLPPATAALEEGTKLGVAGANGWREPGWGGPLPPEGDPPHHYHFRVYALDAPTTLAAGASRDQLLAALRGHVIAQGELIGTYRR